MGFNWEQVFGTKGAGLSDTYDQSASDALYQDQPSAAPQASPEDPGDGAEQASSWKTWVRPIGRQ